MKFFAFLSSCFNSMNSPSAHQRATDGGNIRLSSDGILLLLLCSLRLEFKILYSIGIGCVRSGQLKIHEDLLVFNGFMIRGVCRFRLTYLIERCFASSSRQRTFKRNLPLRSSGLGNTAILGRPSIGALTRASPNTSVMIEKRRS